MIPSDVPNQSSRWKAVLLLVAVFVLGGVCGVGGTLYYVRVQIRQAVTGQGLYRDRLERLADRVETRLTESLKLDAAERSAVREELAVSLRRARLLRLRMYAGVRGLISDTLSRIGNRLPPEKRNRLMDQADARLKPWGLEPRSGASRPEPKETP